MKKLIILLMVLATVAAYAATPKMAEDGAQRAINGFAPKAGKTVTLGTVRQTVNHSDDIAYSASGPSDCYFRIMSTSTVAGTKLPAYGGRWDVNVVNPFYKNGAKSAFTNWTGCTGWVMTRQ